MIERYDTVSIANRGQAVGNHEDRASLGDLRHVMLDDLFAFVIERARGFVEYQDARLAQQRASNCNTLALATREAAAAFANDRIVALRQLQDEVMSPGKASLRQ